MASLINFFAQGTQAGSNEDIEVKVLFIWDSVGTGQFKALSQFNGAFEGQIQSVFYTGAMNLSLTLNDQNPGAQQGPASVTFNGMSDRNASYQVNGNTLVINASLGGKSETLAIHAGDGGTYLNVSGAGVGNRSVFLKPM